MPDTSLRGHATSLLAACALLLAGCATNPKAALPAVQEAVASRSGLAVDWRQTAEERAAADRAVSTLLEQELTPERAVEIAFINNRELRATFEDLGISQAELIAASRLTNPSFGAGVRWPSDRPRGPNVELSVAADLLDGILLPVRKKIAKEHLGQTVERVAHRALLLAGEVKAVAYTVQARQQLLTRLSAIVEVNDAAADLAQRQYDAGNINRLELANQQAMAQESHLEHMRTEAMLRTDREKLNRLLGLSSGQTGWKISPLPGLPETDALPADLEDLAVAQRLDVAAMKSQVTLAEQALSLKRKTRLLPASVNLGIDTERDPDGARVTGPSLELALPIFDQGQAELARLGAELRRATAGYEGLLSDVRSQTREALETLLAARASADYYVKTLLPQRRLLLRETLLHYNAMQKSSYELLAAKERQIAIERESIEALRDYWIARTSLEMAVGGKLPVVVAAVDKPAEEPPPPEHHHHGSN
ncbi:MAG TPA: TolC family protein [Candidatus Didemnitutus sp.]|nr:TolC family protein [Candidatus Didemnitutus sp.]